MNLNGFNTLGGGAAGALLESCLAVPGWIDDVLAGRPYDTVAGLLAVARDAASSLTSERVEDALAPRGSNPPSRRCSCLPLAGTYRLVFDTAAYFARTGAASFFPTVDITFSVVETAQNYHVPVLLSPFGYSTYRGR